MDDKLAELFGKVKSTAFNVYNAAESATKTASQKVGKSIDNTKVNIKIYNLTNERKELYAKLGELTYLKVCGEATDSNEESSLISEIKAKSQEIELFSMQENDNESVSSKVCPYCGAECKTSDTVCSVCGKSI